MTTMPTLREKTIQVPCSGGCGNWDCDGWERTIHQCAICKEEIEPGTVPDSRGRTVLVSETWTVCVRSDTPPPAQIGEVVTLRVAGLDQSLIGLATLSAFDAASDGDGMDWVALYVSTRMVPDHLRDHLESR